MSKTELVGVRLEPHEKYALAQVAAADDRSLSAVARRMVVEALQRGGYLPVETKPR